MSANTKEVDDAVSVQGLLYQSLDGVLSKIGQFGPYQKQVVFLVSLVAFSTAFNNLGYVFWAARMDHHCEDHYHALDVNISSEDKDLFLNRSIPWELNRKGESVRSPCHQYRWDSPSKTFLNGMENNRTEQESCQKWSYDTSVFKSSIVSEMNLVCSQKWLVSATQSVYMAGRIAGSVIYGHASDRFGRRPSLMAAIGLQLVFSNMCCWMSNIYGFLVVRFLLGIHTTGEFQIAFVMASENVGPSYRTLTGIIIHLFWAIGYISIAGIAYFIRERFWLQVALTAPLSLLVILYWFVPETPRFLLSSGQREECLNQLKKMSVKNKIEFPKEVEDNLQVDEKVENCTLLDLCKYKNIRRTTLILTTAWFAASFVYYGLTLNSASFSGDPYLNFFLSGIIEIPSYILVQPLFSRFGRLIPFSSCLFTAGILLMSTVLLPNDSLVCKTTMTILGKGAITCAYAMVYILSAELYPTKMRSIGVGTCSVFSRLAATLAPFAADLAIIWQYLPFVTFCGVSFTAGFLVLLLPETRNKPLPQTIEEGEQFNGKHNLNLKCWKQEDNKIQSEEIEEM